MTLRELAHGIVSGLCLEWFLSLIIYVPINAMIGQSYLAYLMYPKVR